MIKYDEIKESVISLISPYLAPKQTSYEGTINTSSALDILQSFIPLSSTISTLKLYVHNLIGSPDPISVYMLNAAQSTISTTPYTLSAGWNSMNIPLPGRPTRETHYVKVSTPHDIAAYANLGMSTVNVSDDTLWVGGVQQDGKLSYEVMTSTSGTLIHKTFPKPEPSIESYPIVVMDITGRPRVNQRWMNPRMIEETIVMTFEIYSRYPSEIDLITRRLEKGMFRERKNISGIWLINPGGTSSIVKWRENIFMRPVSFNLNAIVQVE